MTQLQKRTPQAVGVVLSEGRVSAPLAKRRELLALLAKMQRRGEIGTAWTEGDAMENGEYVVHFERLREPRSRVPWYGTLFAISTGAAVGVGALIYHSRYVLLWGAVIALALVGIVAYAMSRGGSSSAHQCGRPSC